MYFTDDDYDVNSLEGLIDRSVPAEEGAGTEEDEPEDGQTEANTLGGLSDEEGEAGKNVEEQSHAVHWRTNSKNRIS